MIKVRKNIKIEALKLPSLKKPKEFIKIFHYFGSLRYSGYNRDLKIKKKSNK